MRRLSDGFDRTLYVCLLKEIQGHSALLETENALLMLNQIKKIKENSFYAN